MYCISWSSESTGNNVPLNCGMFGNARLKMQSRIKSTEHYSGCMYVCYRIGKCWRRNNIMQRVGLFLEGKWHCIFGIIFLIHILVLICKLNDYNMKTRLPEPQASVQFVFFCHVLLISWLSGCLQRLLFGCKIFEETSAMILWRKKGPDLGSVSICFLSNTALDWACLAQWTQWSSPKCANPIYPALREGSIKGMCLSEPTSLRVLHLLAIMHMMHIDKGYSAFQKAINVAYIKLQF